MIESVLTWSCQSDSIAVSPEIYQLLLEELEAPQKKKTTSTQLVRNQRGASMAKDRREKFEAYKRSIHEHIEEARMKYRVAEVLDQCEKIIFSNDLELDFALWVKSMLQNERPRWSYDGHELDWDVEGIKCLTE